MNIYLYQSTCERNEFPKTLPEPLVLEGNFRDECDVLNPVIVLTGFNGTTKYNYCYIPDLARYYFIESANMVRTNVIEYTMHVDVLNSWATEILQQECVVGRNENVFNPMIVDDIVEIQPDSEIRVVDGDTQIEYPNNFYNSDVYISTVVTKFKSPPLTG